ncbi:MAG: hypothetical protein AB1656_06040 [Candidatus Omnitrophota bacterium]
MNSNTQRNFLLYLKALIWSVYVSYKDSTVALIAQCLREGSAGENYPEFRDSHLGDCLRTIIQSLPRTEDRNALAACLQKVKSGEASMVYRNMVIEVGHYVTARETIEDVPENCYGVVYFLASAKIDVLFRKPDGTLSAQCVFPFQIMPVYTLTVPDITA